jgi:uncharacterized protein (TIGR02145 family)
MKKNIFAILTAAFIAVSFTSCEKEDEPIYKTEPTQGGIIVGGVEWARTNVAAPGTFAENPEDVGMFYQWNRRTGWCSVTSDVEGWNSSTASGSSWSRANDPCPQGWRVPTQAELRRLSQTYSIWTTVNGVSGHLFGTAPNQIFLAAAGWRDNYTGALSRAGESGRYWSSTQSNDRPRGTLSRGFRIFIDGTTGLGSCHRAAGLNIRCVSDD